MTCPRCDRPARYLVRPYWDSPNEGLCSACCLKAAKHFDKTKWPPFPPDDRDPALVPA